MGTLCKSRTYLAGHMEFGDGTQWRDIVKNELTPRGIIVFDPYFKPYINGTPEDDESRKQIKSWMQKGEYEQVHTHMKKVRAEDMRQVDLCDFFIVYVDRNIPTWGTVEETALAVSQKKPVFIIIKDGIQNCPLWLLGMAPVKYFYNSLEECLVMIKKIDDGIVPIDSDRWHILKQEYH